MSTIITVPRGGGNQPPPHILDLAPPANAVLASAHRELALAVAAGKGDRSLSTVDFLARLSRRHHGADLSAARRTLAVLLGELGNPHGPVTVVRLASRIRHALVRTGINGGLVASCGKAVA